MCEWVCVPLIVSKKPLYFDYIATTKLLQGKEHAIYSIPKGKKVQKIAKSQNQLILWIKGFHKSDLQNPQKWLNLGYHVLHWS